MTALKAMNRTFFVTFENLHPKKLIGHESAAAFGMVQTFLGALLMFIPSGQHVAHSKRNVFIL
jgi:hypothetical protein